MIKYFYQTTVWKLLVQLSGFLLNLLIARYFGASQSGNLFYLLSIYSLIILFLSFSLESGIIYFGTKQIISFNRLISLSIIIAVGSVSLVFLYFLFVPHNNNLIPDNQLLFWSAVSFITGNLLQSFGGSLFYAKNNFTFQHKIAFLFQTILLLILVFKWADLLPSLTDTDYFLFYFISYLVMGISCFVFFIFQQKEKFRFSLPSVEQLRLFINYCALAWIGNLIFFLLYRIDYVFVEELCSVKELGNYIQVSKIAQLFFILPTILASIIFPLTVLKPADVILKWITSLSRLIFLSYSIICLIAIATGKWLFPFVFGPSFTDMYLPFVLLVPGILSLSVSFTLTAYFAGIKKLDINIRAAILALGVVVAGNFIGVRFYSIQVAAVVSSISYIVLMIYLINIMKKQHSLVTSDFFLFRSTDLTALKSIILNYKA
ncbi:MAG: lipopolysaccharide biosynthesis protein [Ginsengibacter sp.]